MLSFRSSERDLKIVQEKLQQAQETRIRISANQDMLKFVTCIHTYCVEKLCTTSIC